MFSMRSYGIQRHRATDATSGRSEKEKGSVQAQSLRSATAAGRSQGLFVSVEASFELKFHSIGSRINNNEGCGLAPGRCHLW
jgi:hypothetical protein